MRIQNFDFTVDVLQVILWQYNDAVNIQGILNAKQAWYTTNETDFWNDWYTNVFNLATANEFGLSVWSIILGLPLQLGPPPDPPNKASWAYGPLNQNYGWGNFSDAGNGIVLTLEEKRLVLQLRYYKLTSRAEIPRTNTFLSIVFASLGTVYVLDGLSLVSNMTITVVFLFQPSRELLKAIKQFDLIPRGAGVGINYLINPGPVFGYGPYNQNYGWGGYQPGT